MGVFGWSYGVLMAGFARDVLGRGANGLGILMSASGTGALIGALVVGPMGICLRREDWRSAASGYFRLHYSPFSLSRNFSVPSHFFLLLDLECSCFFSTSNTVLQTIVPDEMRGRVMGVWSLVFGAMISWAVSSRFSRLRALGWHIVRSRSARLFAQQSALVTLLVIRRNAKPQPRDNFKRSSVFLF